MVWTTTAQTDTLASRVSEKNSNNAEMAAIFFAVLLSDPVKDLTVFTDSEACLTKLNKTQQNCSVDDRLTRVAKTVAWVASHRTGATQFVKIKAHSGVRGNEDADTLARDGNRRPPWPRVPRWKDPDVATVKRYLNSCNIDPSQTVLP